LNEQFINIRKKIGLSQKEIAEYLDANQNYIIKIENGECSLPVDLAEKMCMT
jgi:transcriptional regulator with XRE-family HTH domain